jgi:hypothetical protein
LKMRISISIIFIPLIFNYKHSSRKIVTILLKYKRVRKRAVSSMKELHHGSRNNQIKVRSALILRRTWTEG